MGGFRNVKLKEVEIVEKSCSKTERLSFNVLQIGGDL